MQLKKYDFDNLPFSDLFLTYVSQFDDVAEFYETNPFDSQALKEKAAAFEFAGDRDRTASILKDFNGQLDIDSASPVYDNIERLRKDDALVIVTGQQLGLYGGPLFTMFKTITAIHKARKLEEELDRPVIPVFWFADEDHDYEEIRRITLPGEDNPESFSLPRLNGDVPPVSELDYPEEIEALADSVRDTLVESSHSDDLWDLLKRCFAPGGNMRRGFGNFIAALFAEHGLVLAGSNMTSVKQETKEILKAAVSKADEVREALEKQSQKIGHDFQQQVKLYDSHLFYIDDDAGRVKISRNDEGQWITEAGQTWNGDELIEAIDNHPEKFSPDVFLRPVLQDRLLPTLGYVAGPGEIAYYGQMKSYYHCFDQQMPAIIPRLSATFIEPAIDRIMDEVPFELKEYNSRIEDLETAFVDRTEEADIDALFKEWKSKAEEVSESFIRDVIEIDHTLEGAAAKAMTVSDNAKEDLKKKVYRAVKKREEIQLKRIRRIQQNLFPGRNLQEREICGIYYMNKFGTDIWSRLLGHMDDTSSNAHTLIYL